MIKRKEKSKNERRTKDCAHKQTLQNTERKQERRRIVKVKKQQQKLTEGKQKKTRGSTQQKIIKLK